MFETGCQSIGAYLSVTRFIAMAESNESGPIARATKPVSEALLNEKVRVSFNLQLSEIILYDLNHKIRDNYLCWG
jgi:hypothetical protein